MTLLAERPSDRVDESELVVGRRIQEFSQLAGPVSEIAPDQEPYRVSYRGVDAVHGRGRVARSLVVAALNFLFEALFFVWLLHPSHRPSVAGPPLAIYANWFVIGSIGLMELMRLVNVLSLSLASMISRDPVPVPPLPDRKVAFLTTIVPDKEPIDVVRGTLQAALRIRYRGILDVWILDEGDDPAVKAMCRELGVNHFTRRGVERYNRRKGAFKARTKHGNYNAWVAEHGDAYEVFLSVDPDHVPLPNYAERILGYFRDPDVAFVVGPQCYANDETFVTRAAESQQFPFHSLIQRAANRYNAAMLVGTNNAIRISSLKAVGGLSDSVTEDLATGLKFHARRNGATGHRWKSVYTPDVLAVGEGPSSWGDFFSQQMRWSRGTFEVLLTDFWRRLPKLSPGRALHYCLITTFYPSMAIGWVLGAVNAVLFLMLGVQGVVVPVQLWLALYIDATAFQLWVYLRNRRYNVSPYEPEGSSGVKGMFMSIFASPIFATSMIATILRLPTRFVVTPKGLSSSADHILTFRRHLQWALVLIAAIVASVALGYASPAVLLWPAVALAACLAPPVLWIVERVVGRQPAMQSEAPRSSEGKGVTTESLERAALDQMIASGTVSPARSPLSVPFPAVTTSKTAVSSPRGAPRPAVSPWPAPAGRPGAPAVAAAGPGGPPPHAGRGGPGPGVAPGGPVPPSREDGHAPVGDLPPGWRRRPRPDASPDRYRAAGEHAWPRPDGPDAATGRLPRGEHAVNGRSTSPGPAARPGPHGAVPPGAAAHGVGPHGAGPHGVGSNGAALNGAGSNGAALNGAGSNGAALNGAGPNGAGPNGQGPNGQGPNGQGPNGASGNGVSANGAGPHGAVPRGPGDRGDRGVRPGAATPPAPPASGPRHPAPAPRAATEDPSATAAAGTRSASDLVGPVGPRFRNQGGKRARTEADESQTDTMRRDAIADGRPVEPPDGAGTNPHDTAAERDEGSVHASTVAVRVVALAAVARPAEVSSAPAGEQAGAS